MRAFLRIGLAALVLGAAAVGAGAWLLPALAESDAVRTRLQNAFRDGLGAELDYDHLALGWLPPHLAATQATLEGGDGAWPVRGTATSVRAQFAWRELVRGRIGFESLRVDGAVLRFRRGSLLPARADASVGAARREPRGLPPPARLELRDATLELEDVRGTLPLLVVTEVQAVARRRGRDGVDFEASGRLEAGGALRVRGSWQIGRELRAQIELGGAVVETGSGPAAWLGGSLSQIDAVVSGDLAIRSADAGAAIEADLELKDAAVQLGEFGLRGPLALEARFGDPDPGESLGRFQIDAARARLAYRGQVIAKALALTGEITRDAEGRLAPKSVRLSARDFKAQLTPTR